ncbi:HAD family hydrolase [Companilactobacillus ginsenosidimutans]|uniref:Hydrolase n=1 Tax=Companilactobacillus ginsenosidimutans TaxID=1007676 RepID=A0A0H4QDY8_9LACO|nr:HAD family hydrolase [Companilactobacillus ginsenosidimutans]AKP66559.1 hypothetical protein ABM34_02650 [Companilactobacillus ginsenosidimutans]
MGKYKIAFFDVDGTLATNTGADELSILERVPESTKFAIDQLKSSGIRPVIATGRNHGMIKDLIDALGIDNVVANNGRFVLYNGKVIAHEYFSDQQVNDIVDYLLTNNIEFCYETANVLYKNDSSRFHSDSSMEIRNIPDGEIPQQVIQMIFRADDSDTEIDLNVPGIKAVKVGPTVYDVTADKSNKAVGIEKYLNIANVESSQVIAFGDEENDIEMFEKVGYSVAMGNANPKVKQVADFVTTNVDNNGILNAIQKLELVSE